MINTGLTDRTTVSGVSDEPRYVVALATAATPQALRRPSDAAYAEYSVFITREQDQGRDRYCLQMGHFRSMAEAAAMAASVRTRYPSAMARMASDDHQRRRAVVQQMLSDTQTLRLLQQGTAGVLPAGDCVRVITPDDPQALQELEAEVQAGVAASFAVQLAWSVHPIDSARIGYLPVFSKAVLYPLRGLRQGRAWYAYRLGFFDSVEAAQQMASPLREHYAAVVIVPVSGAERQRALQAKAQPVAIPPAPVVETKPIAKPLDDIWLRNEPRGNTQPGADLNQALRESVRPREPIIAAKPARQSSGLSRWLGLTGSPRGPKR
jgi:hypothetical protein